MYCLDDESGSPMPLTHLLVSVSGAESMYIAAQEEFPC